MCVCVIAADGNTNTRLLWKFIANIDTHTPTHAVNFCSAISYKRSFDAPTLALDTKIIKSGDFCFFQNVGIFLFINAKNNYTQ